MTKSVTYCECSDNKTGVGLINAMIVIAWNHGVKYNFKPFVFCPWCGGKIKLNKEKKK